MKRREFIISSVLALGGIPLLHYIKNAKNDETQGFSKGENEMKVLLINGSCHVDGTTFTALSEVAKVLEKENISTEIIQLKAGPQQDCIACGRCRELKKCVFDDVANEIIEKAKASDGIIVGSPVYYAHPSGRLLSVLDRVFYAGGAYLKHKPAASIAVARRAGTTATLDVINKYFTINQMPVISSTYWNMVFGLNAKDAVFDKEGLQSMRNLARNMANTIKLINEAKELDWDKDIEKTEHTNFVR